MGRHNVSRVKIIPEKTFYKIWHSVPKFDNRSKYVNNFILPFSKDFISWSKKTDVDPGTMVSILIKIYDYYHMDIKTIIKESHLTRAAFGYKYCIPIRTLEEWCKKDTSPDYVRLYILKDLGIFKLPKFIHIE